MILFHQNHIFYCILFKLLSYNWPRIIWNRKNKETSIEYKIIIIYLGIIFYCPGVKISMQLILGHHHHIFCFLRGPFSHRHISSYKTASSGTWLTLILVWNFCCQISKSQYSSAGMVISYHLFGWLCHNCHYSARLPPFWRDAGFHLHPWKSQPIPAGV